MTLMSRFFSNSKKLQYNLRSPIPEPMTLMNRFFFLVNQNIVLYYL